MQNDMQNEATVRSFRIEVPVETNLLCAFSYKLL